MTEASGATALPASPPAPTSDLHGAELVARLRLLEPQIRAEGIVACALFGSRARGDHRPDSDIDLLVTPGDDPRFSLLNMSGVGLLVEDVFGLPTTIMLASSVKPNIAKYINPDLLDVF